METTLLRQYAEVGAEVRLRELDHERKQILRAFPRLNGHTDVSDAPVQASDPTETKRTRKPMTQAQRHAIRRRMKAIWRERKAKAKA